MQGQAWGPVSLALIEGLFLNEFHLICRGHWEAGGVREVWLMSRIEVSSDVTDRDGFTSVMGAKRDPTILPLYSQPTHFFVSVFYQVFIHPFLVQFY